MLLAGCSLPDRDDSGPPDWAPVDQAKVKPGAQTRTGGEGQCTANFVFYQEDAEKVNPSLPKFGGPTGIGTTAKGQSVYTYGSSELRLGIELLSPKSGVAVETSPAGWSHTVYTLTPGIPGDSGSAMLNRKGEALGVVSTLAFLGKPGSNGVGDMGKELAYARAHGFGDLELARGTEKFRASFLGLT